MEVKFNKVTSIEATVSGDYQGLHIEAGVSINEAKKIKSANGTFLVDGLQVGRFDIHSGGGRSYYIDNNDYTIAAVNALSDFVKSVETASANIDFNAINVNA